MKAKYTYISMHGPPHVRVHTLTEYVTVDFLTFQHQLVHGQTHTGTHTLFTRFSVFSLGPSLARSFLFFGDSHAKNLNQLIIEFTNV